VVGVLVLACVSVAIGAPPEERFAEAQEAFESARKKLEDPAHDAIEVRRAFYESATKFAALASEGIASSNLYVNTGNAYHFAGDEPRALLWYLRAARLANTPETRAGVATLRRLCKTDLPTPEKASIGRALMFWHYDLGRRTKQVLLLATYPLGCVLTVISLFASRPAIWRRLGIALMLVGGVIGVSDLVTALAPPEPWALVLEQTRGYAGDGESYSPVVETIVPGQEVKVIETRKEWIQIELPSGTRCWIRAALCEVIWPEWQTRRHARTSQS